MAQMALPDGIVLFGPGPGGIGCLQRLSHSPCTRDGKGGDDAVLLASGQRVLFSLITHLVPAATGQSQTTEAQKREADAKPEDLGPSASPPTRGKNRLP